MDLHMLQVIGHCYSASIFYSFLLLFTPVFAIENPLVISIYLNL